MASNRYTLRHSIHLVLAMGWADFVLKYRGTTFGYLWSLIPPLTKFLAILYVLGPFVSSSIPHYPMYLFLGLIIWDHFVMTTSSCMAALRSKSALIQKIVFPRIIIMLAVGWTHFIIFFTQFLILLLFMIILHIPLTWAIFFMPVVVIQMTLLALGIGMILSSYSLRFQDIRHMWDVALQVLFWLTPITYPLVLRGTVAHEAMASIAGHSSLPWGFLHAFITLQPLSVVMYDARRVLLYPIDGIPTFMHILVFSLLYVMIFALGAWIYTRRSRYFIQEF